MVLFNLSKEFYDRCPPSYQKVFDDFQTKLSIIFYPSSGILQDKAKYAQEIQAAILKFSSCYFTPIELFELYIRLAKDIKEFNHSIIVYRSNCEKVAEIAYFHLHYKPDWMRIPFSDSKYYFQSSDEQCLRDDIKLCDYVSNKINRQINYFRAEESDLTYPHPCLTECHHIFERNASHVPSLKLVQRCESMKQLYNKIRANKDYLEKWFKLLLEADDNNFVKDTVEYRLGKNCLDVKLWKLYLTFLKEHGEHKRLLETYSKYCRFFLDDEEMKEKYKKDMIEYGPIDLPWNNLFEFEVKVTSVATLIQGIKAAVLKPVENLPTVEKKEVVPFDKNFCSTFYDTYLKYQQFALPNDSMIQHILKHANHRVLRKLFASCKYFFKKRRTPICYSLVKKNGTKFDDENLTLDYLADPNLFLKNTYVTGNLFANLCAWRGSHPVLMNRRFVSNLIPRLYRCEAKYIHLTDQELSYKELLFLVEHGGVVDFRSHGCKIVDENGKHIDLEKYMEYLPKVEWLELCPTYVNANTGHALAELKFSSKIEFIFFEPIYGYRFDAKEFIKFCDAIRGGSITVDMVFDDDDFNEAFVESFKEIMSKFQNNTDNTSINISRVGDDYISDDDD